jgi:hypothetical protein
LSEQEAAFLRHGLDAGVQAALEPLVDLAVGLEGHRDPGKVARLPRSLPDRQRPHSGAREAQTAVPEVGPCRVVARNRVLHEEGPHPCLLDVGHPSQDALDHLARDMPVRDLDFVPLDELGSLPEAGLEGPQPVLDHELGWRIALGVREPGDDPGSLGLDAVLDADLETSP